MKIPTIGPENVRQVTSESSEREVEPSRIQGVGDSIATIAGQAQDSAMLLYKAGKARDNLRAENVADVAQSKLMADLDNEKDFTAATTAKYKERAQKHDLDSANLISNPVDRQNFLLQRESKRNIQNIQIEHLQEARMVKDYKAQMELKAANGGTAYVQTDFSTTGNLIRQKQVAELSRMLDKGLETKVYDTKAERDLAQKTILDSWHKAKVDFDINKDATLTLERLNNHKYDSILTGEQVLVAKENATKQIRFNTILEKNKIEQAKQAQIQKEHNTLLDVSTAVMNKDPQADAKIKAAIDTGAMTTDTGFYIKLAASSPEKWEEAMSATDASGNKPSAGGGAQHLIDSITQMGDNPAGRTKLLQTALQNVNDPKSGFSKADLTFFLRTAAGKNADPENPIWGWTKVAFSGLGAITSRKTQQVASGLFQKVWDFKSDPRPVMDAAVQDAHQQSHTNLPKYVVGQEYKGLGKFVKYSDKTGNPVFDK